MHYAMKAIGDRIKGNYEKRCRHELTRRMPVVIRVDGRAFHTYTRGMERPFSQTLIDAMVTAAQEVGKEAQGFKAGYVQSDEASFLLTDYDTLQTDAWFGYVQSKVETIAASVMTATFNRSIDREKDALFDARAFSVPREEVVNYFLWRAMDWERNSVSMYCHANFSARQMHGQGKADQHEMLHSIGKNWATDLTAQQRNGTWIFTDGTTRTDVLPNYDSIASMIDQSIYVDKEQNLVLN